MLLTPLIAQADLEKRFGQSKVVQFADDNNVGNPLDSAVQERVAEVCLEATDIAVSILGQGWTFDQVTSLAQRSPSITGAICDIAISILSGRRPDLVNSDGTSPYDAKRSQGQKLLERFAKRQQDPAATDIVGDNRTGESTTNRPARALIFQGNSRNPRGQGGF